MNILPLFSQYMKNHMPLIKYTYFMDNKFVTLYFGLHLFYAYWKRDPYLCTSFDQLKPFIRQKLSIQSQIEWKSLWRAQQYWTAYWNYIPTIYILYTVNTNATIIQLLTRIFSGGHNRSIIVFIWIQPEFPNGPRLKRKLCVGSFFVNLRSSYTTSSINNETSIQTAGRLSYAIELSRLWMRASSREFSFFKQLWRQRMIYYVNGKKLKFEISENERFFIMIVWEKNWIVQDIFFVWDLN